jgi:hypothetical protein
MDDLTTSHKPHLVLERESIVAEMKTRFGGDAEELKRVEDGFNIDDGL